MTFSNILLRINWAVCAIIWNLGGSSLLQYSTIETLQFVTDNYNQIQEGGDMEQLVRHHAYKKNTRIVGAYSS